MRLVAVRQVRIRLVEQLGERKQLEELEGRPDIEEQQVRFVE